MTPRFTPFTTTAALICLLLVLLPQSVVGFASYENPRTASVSSSYRTSKLLQSSRVLPSDDSSASISLPPLIRGFQNLQERLVTYRHLRKQQKLRQANEASASVSPSLVQGFVPVAKQFLYKPNKMFLQAYILAHQQAQYDHLHLYHESALKVVSKVSSFSSTDLSVRQRFAERRREAKNSRLATKYAAIESLEDRAFQICKDLGMI